MRERDREFMYVRERRVYVCDRVHLRKSEKECV